MHILVSSHGLMKVVPIEIKILQKLKIKFPVSIQVMSMSCFILYRDDDFFLFLEYGFLRKVVEK